MPSTISLAITFLLTLLLTEHFGVHGQNCYYPNGDLATEGDAACTSDGGACCPLNWQCMSNGACYNPEEDMYGRYTCTDRTWQDPSCPHICTQDNTAAGNEALLWCPSGDWCCDGNRSWNCCTKAGTDFFSLPDPHVIAFISSVPEPTPVSSSFSRSEPSSTDSPISSSDTNTPSSASSPMTSTSDDSPTTFTHETVTTGQDGQASTVTAIITQAPASAQQNEGPAHSSGDSNLGLIIGLALGIPLLLIICAILAFFCYRRKRKSKGDSPDSKPLTPPMEANYQDIAPGSHAPELEGYPVAAKRSGSERRSELYGSEYYKSPTMSMSTTGSSPPQYSPGAVKNMSQINEEPAELWGSGGYIPYRPPQVENVADGNGHENNGQNGQTGIVR